MTPPPPADPALPPGTVVFEGAGFTITDGTESTNALTVNSGGKRVNDVNVLVRGLTHTRLDDVDAYLRGPDNKIVTLAADAGAGSSASGLTLTFDDEATRVLPQTGSVSPGSYRPASYGATANFVGPQPPTALRTFEGIVADGTWTLHIYDDQSGATGSLSGWTLQLTYETVPVIVPVDPPPAAGNVHEFATEDPPFRIEDDRVVASSIIVPDMGRPIADVDVKLNGLTHTAVQDLDIKLTNPSEIREVVLMSDIGSGPATDATVRLDDQATATLPTAGGLVSGTYKPRNVDLGDAFGSPDVLSAFNTGGHAGRWILTINDDEPADVGSLRSWSIIITFA